MNETTSVDGSRADVSSLSMSAGYHSINKMVCHVMKMKEQESGKLRGWNASLELFLDSTMLRGKYPIHWETRIPSDIREISVVSTAAVAVWIFDSGWAFIVVNLYKNKFLRGQDFANFRCRWIS